jgi:hypothetical protein
MKRPQESQQQGQHDRRELSKLKPVAQLQIHIYSEVRNYFFGGGVGIVAPETYFESGE